MERILLIRSIDDRRALLQSTSPTRKARKRADLTDFVGESSQAGLAGGAREIRIPVRVFLPRGKPARVATNRRLDVLVCFVICQRRLERTKNRDGPKPLLPKKLSMTCIPRGLKSERLDHFIVVIHHRITMKPTASVRDLRNHFPKVRKILEEEGEVLLTESGKAKYRLVPYSTPPKKTPPAIDFWGRLKSYQPSQISAEASRALDDENRGYR